MILFHIKNITNRWKIIVYWKSQKLNKTFYSSYFFFSEYENLKKYCEKRVSHIIFSSVDY